MGTTKKSTEAMPSAWFLSRVAEITRSLKDQADTLSGVSDELLGRMEARASPHDPDRVQSMSDKPPFTQKHQTAYHEAGHAVIAWLCNHEVISVTIRPDEEAGSLGTMRHDENSLSDLFAPFKLGKNPNAPGEWLFRNSDTTGRPLTNKEQRWMTLSEEFLEIEPLERDLLVAAAGEQAERKLGTVPVEPRQSRKDWESVAESLEILADKRKLSPTDIRAEAAARVASLLDDSLVWQAVENVANALIRADSETLNRDEAVNLMRKTFTDEWNW